MILINLDNTKFLKSIENIIIIIQASSVIKNDNFDILVNIKKANIIDKILFRFWYGIITEIFSFLYICWSIWITNNCNNIKNIIIKDNLIFTTQKSYFHNKKITEIITGQKLNQSRANNLFGHL
jgi:hypothetical protein